MLFSIAVAACGGGGGGSSTPASTTSGTAAQYFTKKAVGNTWTSLETNTSTITGQPTSTTTTTYARTITASTGGVVTYSDAYNGVTLTTSTTQIDATGALVSTLGTLQYADLPATFSVGTTWVKQPAGQTLNLSAVNATIAAFNVTRTVPAGTFTDCLQINYTYSSTGGGVTTTNNDTTYFSPTAGGAVETTGSSSSTNGSTSTFTSQLQAGYIANP